MKRCPYCAEKIRDEAVLCRYCGKEQPESGTPKKVENKKWGKKKILLSVGIIVGVLLLSVGGYFLFTKMSASVPTPAPMAGSTPTQAAIATASLDTLSINFDNLPAGVPPDWKILYAPFIAESQPPEEIKAGVQENHFSIENQGTYSGLFALYIGAIPSPNLQISLDAVPDQGNAMSVFLVCRYSEAGWYQFRVGNGSSQIQYVQPQGNIFNPTILTQGPGVSLDNETHRLSGICDHNKLSLLADGTEILSTVSDLLPTGAFGFGVESYDKPFNRKAFDNLEIQFRAPEPTATPTTTPTSTAAPTPTAAPTLRPTLIPADELVLYQTDFENEDASLSKWHTFAYSFSSHSLGTEGYDVFTNTSLYRFNTTETNQRIFAIYDADLGTSDVDISLHATASYSVGNVGLVCRYSEAGWYQFVVEPGGIWSIRLAKYDEAGQLHFYTISSGRRWLGQTADLRAECKGNRLTFYIDGEEQASLHDDTFTEGKVGMLGWSFDHLGEISMIGRFTVQRAQWSTAAGSASTPSSDGVIYTTQFENLETLSQNWIIEDAGGISLPGSPRGFGGPGVTSGPRTWRYINDFDPGVDVEISAGLAYESFARGLICRYSEDGWYQAHYFPSAVALARYERDSQGKLQNVYLGIRGVTLTGNDTLTLACSGNQISVSFNGEVIFYQEDNTWRSGRYGFMFLDEIPNVIRAFSSYTVRPAKTPPQAGETLFSNIFDTLQEFESNWGWFTDDPRVKIQDDSVLLTPGDTVIDLGIGTISENSEVSADLEFLAESRISLRCRGASSFTIHSNGDWEISGSGQGAKGYSGIHPGQNQFTMRCLGSQLTLIANGETLATVELPSYIPAAGSTGLFVEPNSQVKLYSLSFKVMQGSSLPPATTLPNQVSIPVYEPGETIYAWNTWDFLGVAGHKDRAWVWLLWYREGPREQSNQIIVSPTEGLDVWTYRDQDLYDLPLELSADATFTSKSDAIGLMCRLTQLGRYEFVIQPDGSWVIRRNTSDWYEPRLANITVLAQGTSSAIHPDSNQITATCQGNELIFSANGTELGRAEDDLYPEGQVGIFFDANTAGSFTNLNVRRAK